MKIKLAFYPLFITALFFVSPSRALAEDATTSQGSYWGEAQPAGAQTTGAQETTSNSEGKTEAGYPGWSEDTKETFLNGKEQYSDQKVRDADRVGYADWETRRGYVKSNSYGSERYHRTAKKRLAAWKAEKDKADQEKKNDS
jgi:hypothetical protein